MLSYRRNTGMYEYPIFHAENIVDYIDWGNIHSACVDVIHKIFADNVRLGGEGFVVGFTPEEATLILNTPVSKGYKKDNIISFDFDDIRKDNMFTISARTSNLVDRQIIIRDIEVNKDYVLFKPGYRLYISNDQSNRYILSVLHDSYSPSDGFNFIRFVGEVTELVMQTILKALYHIEFFHESPDYNVDISTFSSNYNSTGTLVFKDYPSIKDYFFIYEYIMLIVEVIDSANMIILNREATIDDIVDAYFNGVNKDSTWLMDKSDIKDMMNYNDPEQYISKNIKKLYLEIEGE